ATCTACEVVCDDGVVGPGEVCDPSASSTGCAPGLFCSADCTACVVCWDLNQNLTCDRTSDPATNEDKNDDGSCTPADCVCWDRNYNAMCDINEDTNGDGRCDVSDCVAPCWDLNGNQECDVPIEDVNRDGVCDLLDCVPAAVSSIRSAGSSGLITPTD